MFGKAPQTSYPLVRLEYAGNVPWKTLKATVKKLAGVIRRRNPSMPGRKVVRPVDQCKPWATIPCSPVGVNLPSGAKKGLWADADWHRRKGRSLL